MKINNLITFLQDLYQTNFKMCCQPYIKASVFNIFYALFFTAYFLAQYFLNNEYYTGDLCLSSYVMLCIGIIYFIIGLLSFIMIKNSKYLFPYGLYIFNLCVSIIGILHFAACTIPINVIADARYEFLYFIPPVPAYIAQIACYLVFMKGIRNKIYEQQQEEKASANRIRKRVEMHHVNRERPKTTLVGSVEGEGFISV